jgi:hypothetical protein
LKESLVTASADDNHEEAQRREKLTRFLLHALSSCQLKLIISPRSLEGIEKRSQSLLDKGKGARILDKNRDSGMAAKLVEELRQAILLYQVGTVSLTDPVGLMCL